MGKRILACSMALVSVLGAGTASAWTGKASQVGDMVYKATGSSSGWSGHAGLLYKAGSDRRIADVTDGRGLHALGTERSAGSFENDDYWGARRFQNQKAHGLDYAQQVSLKARVDYFKSYNVMYDFNHLDQKGTWFKHNWWWESASHWEFDCVGFVERVMEDIGLNPTANGYESGAGWPLSPSEQCDSDHLTSAPYVLRRTVRSCATNEALSPQQSIDLTDGSYTSYTCSNRYQEQCIDDGSFDAYYDESCAD
jgi:hypothetical protein